MAGITITAACINDFHGELFESGHALGCARLAALVRRIKAENPHTFVVFGGDNFRGDPVSEHLEGEPVLAFMKHLGVTMSAVGNHEFDFGMPMIRKWSRQGAFAFLAANVLDRRTGDVAEGLAPYGMIEVSGVKVAVIGLTGKDHLEQSHEDGETEHLLIADGAAEAEKWIARLKAGLDPRGKPDVYLALTHYGLKYAEDGATLIGEEAIELCRRVPDLAGVFTAHFHQFVSARINGVPVVQGGGAGRGIALLHIRLTPDRCILEAVPQFLDFTGRTCEIPPDPEMERLMEAYRRRAMETLGVVVARAEAALVHKSPETAAVDMEGTPLTGLAAEVIRRRTGRRIVLFYSGRMGTGLPEGDVTLYQLHKLLPFNDEIITMKLPGKELLRNLEHGMRTLRREGASPLAVGGLRIVADYDRPFGSRIESVRLEDGTPLEAGRHYDIAVDAFLASGGMGFDFSAGIDRTRSGVRIRDSIIEAVTETGRIPVVKPRNVRVKNKA